MATDFIDPNADGTAQDWTAYPSTPAWDCINDGVRQPTSVDSSYIESSTDAYASEFNFTTLTVASVSSVVVWVYHMDGGADSTVIGVQIYMGGSWQTQQNLPHNLDGWDSLTFNGTWTQADLNALQVRVISVMPEGGYSDIFEIYGVVTYSEAGTNMQVNIGDAWKEIAAIKINIGDVWKDAAGMKVNIGDAWKTIF